MPPKADEQRPSQLPEAFVDRLRAIIPAERFDAALASFSAVKATSFRVNTPKATDAEIICERGQ